MQTTLTRNQIHLCPGISRVEEMLIAGEGISAGTPVLAYSGILIDGLDAAERPLRRILRVEENLYMLLDGEAIFPAHNCTPNMGLSGQQTFVALRDIAPGEELTFDYAMAAMGLSSCHCTSGHCRHQVSARDIFDPVIYSRYREFLSPFVSRSLKASLPDQYLMQFEASGAWGIATALDLYECDGETIRSYDKIYEFTVELCRQIKVNRYGEPLIVHFGQDERVAGYSMVQLIETSLVSGHFANLTNHTYLDIFSCAYYDPATVARFSQDFFGAKSYNINTVLRR